MNDNINYIIAKKQAIINKELSQLPISVAYYLIKTKSNELERLYNIQIQQLIAEKQQQEKQEEKQEVNKNNNK